MKLIFLFSNGAKFDLNLPAKLNRTTLSAQLANFQAFCLAAIVDHKRYASGKTTFKVPTHKPSFVGLQMEDGKVVPIRDNAGNAAKIKGYAILSKTGKGKDIEFTANADFARFIWSKVAPILGEAQNVSVLTASVPVLETELQAVLQIAPVKAEKPNAARQIVNA